MRTLGAGVGKRVFGQGSALSRGGCDSCSRRAITVFWVGPRVEPGVTVWGRAGGWVGTAQVMHLPLPKLHLLEAWCARLRVPQDRDVLHYDRESEGCRSRGRVPLRRCAACLQYRTSVLLVSRVLLILGAVRVSVLRAQFRLGDPPGAGCGHGGVSRLRPIAGQRRPALRPPGVLACPICGVNRWNPRTHFSSERACWVRTAMMRIAHLTHTPLQPGCGFAA
jgi:hypothetical protein